jgi:hypothetical protein
VLLCDASKDRGTRLGGCRIKRDHHAPLVDLGDGNSCHIADAKNLADPVQFVKSFALLQIQQ